MADSDSDDDNGRSPVDAVLDVLVFGPLGVALTVRDSYADMIAKGRQQVTSQLTMARMVGQFVVTQGSREAKRRLEDLRPAQPAPAPDAVSDAGIVPAPPPEVEVDALVPVPEAVAPDAPAHAGPVDEDVRASAGADVATHLAIPGYDTLAASQVVQRLAGLAVDELEAVRQYEATHRGRRTILAKAAQLQAGSAG